jgi:hypothetical protein
LALPSAIITGMDSNDLAIRIAERVVAIVAPEELPLFPSASQAFREHPVVKAPDHDDALGFGLDPSAVFISPIVMAISLDVVRHLALSAADQTVRGTGRLTSSSVRRLFRRNRKTDPAAPAYTSLTPQQLGRVRDLACQRAKEMHLSATRAESLADGIVASLATFALP